MVSPERLRRYACFAGITDESLKAIAMISDEKTHRAGTKLFQEDQPADHLFIVAEGEVDIRYAAGVGEYRSVDTLVGGDLMVWSAIIPPHKTHSTAIASKDTRLIAIEAAKLRELCQKDAVLGFKLMSRVAEAVAHRLNGARTQLAAMS